MRRTFTLQIHPAPDHGEFVEYHCPRCGGHFRNGIIAAVTLKRYCPPCTSFMRRGF